MNLLLKFPKKLLINKLWLECAVYSSASATKTSRSREKKSTEIPPDKPCKVINEIEEYFRQNDRDSKLLAKFPPSILRRNPANADRFYLASQETAKIISQHVTTGLSQDVPLIEVNPGLGILTRELLTKRKSSQLILIETDQNFEPDLKRLIASKDPSLVQLHQADFNGHWRYTYLDSLDQGNRMASMMKHLPCGGHHWKDEAVSFRLYSAVDSMRFFKTLMSSVASQKGIFSLGRFEMVLVMSPLVYAHLTCPREAGYKLYRSNTVLFQLFFEHQFLAKVPRYDFLPWPANLERLGKKAYVQRWRVDLANSNDWYLVKVVPRKDLFTYCLPDNLRALAFFVKQNMISRKNRVIPALERWIPHCGARLILNENYKSSKSRVAAAPATKSPDYDHPVWFRAKSFPLHHNDYVNGLNIFTEFGELTPSQILFVFNEFISWPEFHQSPFLQNMEQCSTVKDQDHSRKVSAKGSTDNDNEEVEELLNEKEVNVKKSRKR
ncbi:dimethyladenosine transferase 2, mitochondrial [Uranotaenia lowii]|uniref:dimethyladenosine transferase 2, mitochondrial n=1 Tax=Uranotaenia lowii TaxID=190385 RepID=UPI002479E0CD|nr:dimethyladenosine transferase 2, mitochondrial [Uranotaenia lowii]